jgi:hypothetical protein
MIRPAFIFVSTVTILFLTGCESDQEQKPHPAHHQFGYTGDTTPESTGPIAPPPPPPPPPSTPDQNVGPATTGTNGAPGTAKHDYPYAQPVPGKPGFVTSPYAPYSGYVDVRGFPPGTEVKDPYTQKVFLVP